MGLDPLLVFSTSTSRPSQKQRTDTWEEKPGRKAGSTPQKKYEQASKQSLCGLCVKVGSCEETHSFSQCGLPKPQGEFGSQEVLGLDLCSQGCASLAPGVWAVSLARCTSEPVKLRAFPPCFWCFAVSSISGVTGHTDIDWHFRLGEKTITWMDSSCLQCKQERWKSNQEKRVDVVFLVISGYH